MPALLRLGVNVDHVATIRNARGGDQPDPVRAARVAKEAGADGITAHLREDRRHIIDGDIGRMMERLRKCIADTPVRLPDGTEITATVSIGYSLLGDESDITIDTALQTADEALYQSKEAGRNCCTFRRHRR